MNFYLQSCWSGMSCLWDLKPMKQRVNLSNATVTRCRARPVGDVTSVIIFFLQVPDQLMFLPVNALPSTRQMWGLDLPMSVISVHVINQVGDWNASNFPDNGIITCYPIHTCPPPSLFLLLHVFIQGLGVRFATLDLRWFVLRPSTMTPITQETNIQERNKTKMTTM